VAAAAATEILKQMRRVAAFALAVLLIGLTACGSGPQAASQTTARQPTDPRTVPTATVPAVLPSPIPAGPVTDVNLNNQSAAAPTAYTVKSGDTLAAIASQLGVTLSDLESYNADVNPSSLKIGQELKVPPAANTPTPTPTAGRTPTPVTAITVRPGTPSAGAQVSGTARTTTGSAQTYSVQPGDTACKLAGSFKVSLQELAEANGTSATGLANIHPGQQLKIPAPTGSPQNC
jgi:LysM repeat protein